MAAVEMVQAVWIPAWYELDQSLTAGKPDKFFFWRVAPEEYCGSHELVFYNDLWRPKDALVARGTISSIRNPRLGHIQEIDTRGLSYTISPIRGSSLLVNAEEEPGKIYCSRRGQWLESKRTRADWKFDVEFSDLSAPEPAA